MASSKDRQRKLERERMERRLARQAASQRKKRQIQAGIGASVALILIVVGTVWLTGGFKSSPKPAASVATGSCTWNLRDAGGSIKDTGHPPTTGELRSGTRSMTITTNQGTIEAELDMAKAPCTIQSFVYLSGQKYFDGSPCHRLTTSGIFVLQCGDPSGTGGGGPAYTFADEYLPGAQTTDSPTASAAPTTAPPTNLYPKGTLAMANSGPGTNGSQFFIVYQDGSSLAGSYTIFGKITKGLDLVQTVAKAGALDESGQQTADGEPKSSVVIQSLVVGPAPGETPAPTASVSPSPTASATTQP